MTTTPSALTYIIRNAAGDFIGTAHTEADAEKSRAAGHTVTLAPRLTFTRPLPDSSPFFNGGNC